MVLASASASNVLNNSPSLIFRLHQTDGTSIACQCVEGTTAAKTSRCESSAAANVRMRFHAASCTRRRSAPIELGGKAFPWRGKLEREPDDSCRRDAKTSTSPRSSRLGWGSNATRVVCWRSAELALDAPPLERVVLQERCWS